VIGSVEIRKLDEHHLSKIYKKIVADGKSTTAFELSKEVKQMLTWAEKRKPWRSLMAEGNPADLVEISKILPYDFTKIRDRILSDEELKRLRVALDKTTSNYAEAKGKYGVERPLKKEVQHAMWLCLSTLCRIGELLMAEWGHVDFDKRTWFIPAANTKKVGKRKQTDHLVYLSDFALSQFKDLKELTGDSDWVFPARYKEGHVCIKSASKQVGDRQVRFKQRTKKLQYRIENNSLVVGDVEWTPHDLRTTGATMMQQLDISREIINLCQHHAIGSQIDRHYLLHDFKDKQKDAWYKLGIKLNDIFLSN
jgi:integrase